MVPEIGEKKIVPKVGRIGAKDNILTFKEKQIANAGDKTKGGLELLHGK